MHSATIRRTGIAAFAIGALTLTGCGALGGASQDEPGDASVAPEDPDWTAQAVVEEEDGTETEYTYEPLPVDEVADDLTICALFPNVADDYWAAVNYGSLTEAQRAGVTYVAYQAGGYENLQTQLDQIDGCITQQADAIVLGAISDGACSGVEKAIAAGIPVVDFINGMTCPAVEGDPLFAHVYTGLEAMGDAAADMLLEQGEELTVGLFPGPDGAVFADVQSATIVDRTEGTDVTVAVQRRGNLAEDTQLSLVEDVLRTYPEVNAVVGITAGGAAGVTAVRNIGRQDDVKVFQYAITPSFYQSIIDGAAVASVSDGAPIAARMGVDQAVRLASAAESMAGMRIGPVPVTVTAENAGDIPFERMFAPSGFELTYNWSPES